jgi:chemotaxis protein CheX
MDEKQLRVFVEIVQNYFVQQANKEPEVGTPFLGQSDALPVMDYTGVIGISGTKRGCVYFTAPAPLLREILTRSGELDLSQAALADLAGEVANTISGNARREFGKDFNISVPVIVKGSAEKIQVPKDVRAYIIPLKWLFHEAALVVSVQ